MSFTCPSCHNRIAPGQPSCQACSFSLESVDRLLGIPPQLMGPISDTQKFLSSFALRRLGSRVDRLEKKLPQLRIAVTLQTVPYNVTLPVFTFWLFNRGGLSSSVDRGAENFLVLLVIDIANPKSLRTATMIGYGLEPFLSAETLAACLAAEPTATAESLVRSFLSTLESTLITASQSTVQST